MMDEKRLWNSINKLENWLNQNGWAGLDPYTLQDRLDKTAFYKKFGKNRLVKHFCYRALQIYPDYLLPILKPQPEINAKGLGLLALGYLNLYEAKKDKKYLQIAREILKWLIDNQSIGYPGYSWGYPFDWQSEIHIPAGTPSSVVTVTVGYAFLRAHKILNKTDYLPIIRGIAEFISKGLNIFKPAQNEICFSYTPLDDKQVINANLFAGDYLARAAKVLNDENLQQFAQQIYNYTIRCQNPDGSFYYYGPEQEPRPGIRHNLKLIDHFHTGFVLRTLQSLSENVNGESKDPIVEKGLQFYLDHLFDGVIPNYTPNFKYPVNVHSVSEALLTLNQFKAFPNAKEKLEQFFPWVIKNFQDKSGYFYYNYFPFRKVRIAYLRWGQAWIFYALTQLLKNEHSEG